MPDPTDSILEFDYVQGRDGGPAKGATPDETSDPKSLTTREYVDSASPEIATATSTASGTVKTDSDNLDPIVYLQESVDGLLADKADQSSLSIHEAAQNPHGTTSADVGSYTTTQADALLAAKESLSNKNNPEGYSGLSNGLISDNQIPGSITRDSELSSGLAAKINLSEKGAFDGVATLDGTGKIIATQLPALALTDTFPVASQAAMLALDAQPGDVAIRSDANKTFILRVEPAATLSNWSELLTPTDAVLSVNGQTGAVAISAAGLGALTAGNNLSDVASAATARANLGLAIGTNVQAFNGNLTGLSGLGTTGLVSRTGADTFVPRSIAGVANRTTVTNGTGVSANPTIDIASTYVGQASITTLGTITSGAWAAGTIPINRGGTGSTTKNFVDIADRGVANGVATLGADAKIPTSQIPQIAISEGFPVASQAAMLGLTAQTGDIAIRSDISKNFILSVEPASTLANWLELAGTAGGVTSVNSQTGAVVLAPADVGAIPAANNSVTDAFLGDRTVNDVSVPSTNTGPLTSLVSWLGNQIKTITGKADWKTAPAITLEAANTELGLKADQTSLNTHTTATTQVHGLPANVAPLGNRSAAGEFIQRGYMSSTGGATSYALYQAVNTNVTFPVAFTNLPIVIPGGTQSTAGVLPFLFNVTTTGFIYTRFDTAASRSAVNIGWIALGT